MITVRIPTPLRTLSGGSPEVQVQGKTVTEALAALEHACPGMRARICDGSGELRRFINLFLNQEDVRNLSGLMTEVSQGDVISIIPAIAGGYVKHRTNHANLS